MIEEIDLIKVGSPLALALIILWQVAKSAFKSLADQREDFTKIITNHMVHDQELHEKTIEAMNKLGDTIQSIEQSQRENTKVMEKVLGFLSKNGRG